MIGLMGFSVDNNTAEQLEYDVNGNLIYLGKASAGSLTSEAVWSIKKFTYDVNNALELTEWAEGDSSSVYIWDDRLTYTYS